MTGREHLVFGLASSATAVAVGTQLGLPLLEEHPVILISFATIGALLPDADTTESLAGRILYPIAYFINKIFGHRTITHDVLVMLPLFLLSIFLNNPIFFGIMFGVMSHLFLDGLTKQGIAFFYLKNKEYMSEDFYSKYHHKGYIHLLPKFLRCKSGGFMSIFETYALCALCVYVCLNIADKLYF